MTIQNLNKLAFMALMVLAQSHAVDALAAEESPPGAMVFFDSKLFDAKLSKDLKNGADEIEISVSGKVPLSAIPPRLDKWISKVGETGTVEVKEAPVKTRSFILSLVPMIFSALTAASEERMMAPAEDYHAVLYYKRDSSGDTVIDRLVFKRKSKS